MLDLGATDFNLAINSVEASKLETLSSALFDDWEKYVDQHLALPDYSLFLQIEEGSINGWGRIKSTAGLLFVGISAYGGLVSGVEIISKQASAVGQFLAQQAQNTFYCPDDKTTVKRRGCVPAALQRLFVRVQNGELTPAEASTLAQAMLGDEAAEVPGFFDALSNAFAGCPRRPQQAPLPFDDLIEISPMATTHGGLPKAPKRRVPELPPPLHYRVEVWRESKKKLKQTKLTAL